MLLRSIFQLFNSSVRHEMNAVGKKGCLIPVRTKKNFASERRLALKKD